MTFPHALVAAEFPGFDGLPTIYLNAASTGPLPTRTQSALDEWTRLRAEPWRIMLDSQLATLAEARTRCARIIGGDADEIALTANTSTAINLAASIIPVASGQTILGNDGEFPANVYPWMTLAQRTGSRFEQIGLNESGLPEWDRIPDRLARGDVAILAVSWVSFVTGDRVDLEWLGGLCKKYNVALVVDAIQGVGVAPIDVSRCNISVLACGAQKWLLSPWGSAFAYVRRDLMQSRDPVATGWISVKHAEDFSQMLDYRLDWYDDARKFEIATIAYQDFAGMSASLSLFEEIGVDTVASKIEVLATRLIEGIDDNGTLELVTPRDPARRAGIVSFRCRDVESVSQRLTVAGIIHSVRGGGTIRLSPHFYNTVEQMDRVVEALNG